MNVAQANIGNMCSLGEMIMNNFPDQTHQIELIERSNQIYQGLVDQARTYEPSYLHNSGSLGILDTHGHLKPEFRFPR